MATTDRGFLPGGKLPDPDAAEFAGIRADLSRLFMAHRLDLGLALASGEWIIAHTNDLTATLWFLTQHAIAHCDEVWLRRHH